MPPRTKKQSTEQQMPVVEEQKQMPLVEETQQMADDGCEEKRSKSKLRSLDFDDVLALIDEQITHNEEELSRMKERARLKEGTRILKEIRRFIAKSDQQQKKIKAKPKQTRKPTGFARPRGLSDEMINFLTTTAKINEIEVERKDEPDVKTVKIEPGCKLARNELTKALCRHFKDSNMRKDPEDKRKLYLDDATRKLFRIDVNEYKQNGGSVSESGEPIITYFALQKYLPFHCQRDQ